MPVPTSEDVMMPLLRLFADGGEHRIVDLEPLLARELGLSEEDRRQVIPSGQPLFLNRVSWARTHMAKAGLLEAGERPFWRITPRGRELLAASPAAIGRKFLMQYAEYREFQARRPASKLMPATVDTSNDDQRTPDELMDAGYQVLQANLKQELLDQIRRQTPTFFERLVVDLLHKMGYGKFRPDAAVVTKQSSDEGIDGYIDQDPLGLDVVYVQAKRWVNTVTRDELNKFVGSLVGKHTQKGIFVTTSNFTSGALDYASRVGLNIVLVDGDRLTSLMVEHGLGVSTVKTYDVKRIDLGYFAEGE